LQSNAAVEIAAAGRIRIATEKGAALVIEGGNITFEAPGSITYHTSMRTFAGPTSLSREMNTWAQAKFEDPYIFYNQSTGEPLANCTVELVRMDGSTLRIKTDAMGKMPLQKSEFLEMIEIRLVD